MWFHWFNINPLFRYFAMKNLIKHIGIRGWIRKKTWPGFFKGKNIFLQNFTDLWLEKNDRINKIHCPSIFII